MSGNHIGRTRVRLRVHGPTLHTIKITDRVYCKEHRLPLPQFSMTTPFLQLPLPLHTGTTAPCAHTSSGSTSQFNFKSSVNHKYLSTRAPTLTSTLGEGTAFQLDAENYLMQNGNYLTVRYSHNGFIEFFTSPNPDVQWVGSHLVRKNSGMVVDIYSSLRTIACTPNTPAVSIC